MIYLRTKKTNKSKRKPSVGIVIAVWENNPNYLVSIGSAMTQSYCNCKIIISDNFVK